MGNPEKLVSTNPEGEETYETPPDSNDTDSLRAAEEKDWLIAKLLTEQPEIVPEVYAMSPAEFKEFQRVYLGKKAGEIIEFPTKDEQEKKPQDEKMAG